MVPPSSTRHQTVAFRLAFAIEAHLREHGGGRAFVAPLDVVLSETDVVRPDVVFVAEDRAGIVTEPNIQGPPTLVVEVLSDPAVDRRLKRDLYAHAGIPEYWVVDPDADRVEVHRLAGEGYGKPELLEPGEVLTTTALPGLLIDVADLLRR